MTITSESLANFLSREVDIQRREIELLSEKTSSKIELLRSNTDTEKQNLILVAVTPEEHEILIQSLVARKKTLRSKIRNNEGHLKRMDVEGWTEKDFKNAIIRRRLQLSDTDMLKTRLENL